MASELDDLSREEICEMYHETESELDEANERITTLEQELADLQEESDGQQNVFDDRVTQLRDSFARLLRMIDDGRLVLVDPLFTLEMREAREAFRMAS